MLGKRTETLIDSIDDALKKLTEALNRGQPPYTGKLILTFVDEGASRPAPQVWRLHFTKTNKCLPLRVPMVRLSLRAPRKSSFEIDLEQIKALLSTVEDLLAIRKEAIARIKHMNHWERLFCSSSGKKDSVESFKNNRLEGCN